MAARATASPPGVGGACPSRAATGPRNRKTESSPSSASTAQSSSRLVNQPSCQGGEVALRQAKALASWASTTVVNAAPEAAISTSVGGSSAPGLQPAPKSTAV